VPDWGEPDDGENDGRGPYGGEPHGRESYGDEPDDGERDGSGPHGLEADEREPDGRALGELTYWRRRFVALAVGLGVLSLIAWAFSGTLGASGAGGSTAADGAHAPRGHEGRATAGSGGAGSAGQRGAQPLASASATAEPSASAAPSSSAAPSDSPAAGAQAQDGGDATGQLAAFAPQRATRPARACKAGNIVISLVVAQDSYGKGQLPEFDVEVVSTGTRTCGFNVGARRLSVVVRAHGKQLWASADCAAAHTRLATDLARGVPVIVPVSWNRQTSAAACQGDGKQAPAGSYTASASDGGAASNLVRFSLG
jgi:hypothetical protein